MHVLTDTARRLWAGLRLLLLFTVLLGVLYPLATWGVGNVVARDQAQGSLVRDQQGRIVGSSLIGQSFTAAKWFHGRPSAAGDAGYDAESSGASNLGPNNPELVKLIRARRAQVAKENGVAPSAVPPDAVTASGSGLDPHVSPAYAYLQADRVARARGLSPVRVRALVADHVQGRTLGFLGEPRVNVVELNLALDQA